MNDKDLIENPSEEMLKNMDLLINLDVLEDEEKWDEIMNKEDGENES